MAPSVTQRFARDTGDNLFPEGGAAATPNATRQIRAHWNWELGTRTMRLLLFIWPGFYTRSAPMVCLRVFSRRLKRAAATALSRLKTSNTGFLRTRVACPCRAFAFDNRKRWRTRSQRER